MIYEGGGFWDNVRGGWLPPEEVRKARAEELEWVHKEGVYEVVPAQMARDLGITPIKLVWVDTDKSLDPKVWKIRSRICVQEMKRKDKQGKVHRALPAEMLFSAMPPLEALKIFASLLQTLRPRSRKQMRLRHYDISRAHFMGKAQRTIIVQLPSEDLEKFGSDKVGLLKRSMYGCQDASHIWQQDYVELLCGEGGFVRGMHNAAVFLHEEKDVRIMCHGDDFVVLGDDDGVSYVDGLLRSRYTAKDMGTIGPGLPGEITVLNRKLVQGDGFLDIVPDERHVREIVKECGFTSKTKGVATPREKLRDELVQAGARSPLLRGQEITRYRSVVMRAAYLGQDRPDITETAKSLAQRMSQPTVFDWEQARRLAKYLAGRPRGRLRYYEGELPLEVVVFSDSDWAGDALSRKSTSGCVAFLGRHVLKASSNLQTLVTLSVGESEYYALTKSAAVGLALLSLLADLGLSFRLVVRTDSSAGRQLSARIGAGRIKHMEARYLWVQQRVQAGHLEVKEVPGVKNVSDLLTKPVTRPIMEKFVRQCGWIFDEVTQP